MKRHTATFKAQVTLELLKEAKTVTQIAAEHSVHPGQLHRWKRQAIENFPQLFTESEARKQEAQAHEQQLAELSAQIGKLTTQLEWLKKIWTRPSLALLIFTHKFSIAYMVVFPIVIVLGRGVALAKKNSTCTIASVPRVLRVRLSHPLELEAVLNAPSAQFMIAD